MKNPIQSFVSNQTLFMALFVASAAIAAVDTDPCSPSYGQQVADVAQVQNYQCKIKKVISGESDLSVDVLSLVDRPAASCEGPNMHEITIVMEHNFYDEDIKRVTYVQKASQYSVQQVLASRHAQVMQPMVELFAAPTVMKQGAKEFKLVDKLTLKGSLEENGEGTIKLELLKIQSDNSWQVLPTESYEVFCSK